MLTSALELLRSVFHTITNLDASEKLPISPDNATSVDEIRQVLEILASIFPKEIALNIVDYAEFWIKASAERHECMRVEEDTPREPYISISIPHRKKLRKIVFKTRSHDQGYSWDHTHHGTYEGSWTWFEAGIANRDLPARSIQANLHSTSEYLDHTNTWDVRDQAPDLRQWFDELRDVDVVEVYPMAKFAAWANYVFSVQVDVYSAV